MKDIIIPALMQLLWQAPVLIVYLIGLILALIFLSRCPTPSVLVLVAIVVLLLMTGIHPFVTQYFFHASNKMGWSHEKLSWILSAIGLTSSFFHAAALGLLIAAAFLQRRVPRSAWPNNSVGRIDR
jgi:xanthosine utilization system XapX-like protein